MIDLEKTKFKVVCSTLVYGEPTTREFELITEEAATGLYGLSSRQITMDPTFMNVRRLNISLGLINQEFLFKTDIEKLILEEEVNRNCEFEKEDEKSE